MTAKGWQRRFEDPITLPDGRTLKTLRDAGTYIASLPAKEQNKPHWQTAARELLICAERGGIRMLAQYAMMQALNAGKPEPPREPRRKAVKKYRVIR